MRIYHASEYRYADEIEVARRHHEVLMALADAQAANAPEYIISIIRSQRRMTRDNLMMKTVEPSHLYGRRFDGCVYAWAAETLASVALN
jgi:hypothetical protein